MPEDTPDYFLNSNGTGDLTDIADIDVDNYVLKYRTYSNLKTTSNLG